MITIKLTTEMKNKARKLANNIEDKYKGTDNYTGLVEKDRYYHGYLGEFVFEEYLKQKNRKYKHVISKKSTNEDFIIYNTKKNLTVDVKTASKAYHQYMMMPTERYKKSDCDLYVAVKLYEIQGEILGYATKDEFQPIDDVKVTVPSMGVKNILLKPIK